MRTHFTFYSDPADPRCGWLIVTLRDLEELGLSEMDFTQASYTNGQHIGLEEDVDAPKFLGAYRTHFRRDAEIIDDLGSCRSWAPLGEQLAH